MIDILNSHSLAPYENGQANEYHDTNTIVVGIVIPRNGSLVFNDHYLLQLIQSIAKECRKKEYSVAIFLFHNRKNKDDMYQRLLKPDFCDGLIISSIQSDDPLIPFLLENKIKFVTIGKHPDFPQVNCIDIANEKGAYIATTHLIDQKRQRIATITGPQNMIAGIDRHYGYLNALEDNHISPDETLIVEGQFTEDSGYSGMKTLLPHRPDAVFVASDTMALGALQAIKEAGLSVPQDIALVGFDDIKTATISSPPLTTIKQPINETGKIALSLLLGTLENDPPRPRHKLLDTQLIVRQSSGTHIQNGQ